MDQEQIRNGLMLLNWLTTCAVGLFAWSDRKQRATTESIKALEKSVGEKFDAKCVRLAKVEADLRAMPGRDELARIHERIDDGNETHRETNLLLGEVSGQLKQMNERLKGKSL